MKDRLNRIEADIQELKYSICDHIINNNRCIYCGGEPTGGGMCSSGVDGLISSKIFVRAPKTKQSVVDEVVEKIKGVLGYATDIDRISEVLSDYRIEKKSSLEQTRDQLQDYNEGKTDKPPVKESYEAHLDEDGNIKKSSIVEPEKCGHMPYDRSVHIECPICLHDKANTGLFGEKLDSTPEYEHEFTKIENGDIYTSRCKKCNIPMMLTIQYNPQPSKVSGIDECVDELCRSPYIARGKNNGLKEILTKHWPKENK